MFSRPFSFIRFFLIYSHLYRFFLKVVSSILRRFSLITHIFVSSFLFNIFLWSCFLSLSIITKRLSSTLICLILLTITVPYSLTGVDDDNDSVKLIKNRLNYSDHTQFGSKISKWYPHLNLSQFITQIRNVH